VDRLTRGVQVRTIEIFHGKSPISGHTNSACFHDMEPNGGYAWMLRNPQREDTLQVPIRLALSGPTGDLRFGSGAGATPAQRPMTEAFRSSGGGGSGGMSGPRVECILDVEDTPKLTAVTARETIGASSSDRSRERSRRKMP
jgi:hypothetical protein